MTPLTAMSVIALFVLRSLSSAPAVSVLSLNLSEYIKIVLAAHTHLARPPTAHWETLGGH